MVTRPNWMAPRHIERAMVLSRASSAAAPCASISWRIPDGRNGKDTPVAQGAGCASPVRRTRTGRETAGRLVRPEPVVRLVRPGPDAASTLVGRGPSTVEGRHDLDDCIRDGGQRG